ncbi:hypothetical protein DPMN_189719 [Dreissena polymorpha]|uniref:Uncharacterized protein n=1 Tax=Dreissena polymorpha TaxID=45954 RepID=A0A9D4DTN2_DREPO|nr:hypothetical protein DPMN_189719 [Dreissena polymorpha]
MMMDSTSPGHPVLHKTQRARVTPSFARLDEPRSPRPSQDSMSPGHTVLRKTRRAQVTPSFARLNEPRSTRPLQDGVHEISMLFSTD